MDAMAARRAFISVFMCAAAATLLLSFVFHSLQITHDHPTHAEHGHEKERGEIPTLLLLGEHMHFGDKKLFFILTALAALAYASAPTTFLPWSRFVAAIEELTMVFLCAARRKVCSALFYLQFLFSQGILHTKVY